MEVTARHGSLKFKREDRVHHLTWGKVLTEIKAMVLSEITRKGVQEKGSMGNCSTNRGWEKKGAGGVWEDPPGRWGER